MVRLGLSTNLTAAVTIGTTGVQKLKITQQDITGDSTSAQVTRVVVATLGATDQVERGDAEMGDAARITDANGHMNRSRGKAYGASSSS